MSSSSSPVAAGSSGSYTAEQIRELLHKHLRQSARFIRTVELLVQLGLWLSGLLGLWLVAAFIDHWLLPLPVLGRWLFWIVGVAGSMAWTVKCLIPLLLFRINPVYAARRIEQSNPEFKDGLVSWLQLEQISDNGVPRGIMAGLARHAARYLHDQDPSSTVDSSALIRTAGMLLLLFASLVVYTMASPKSVLATGKRILMPWREIEPPTRVQITEVKPGKCEVTQGLPLRLNVTVRGLGRGEQVSARFTTIDGQLRDQSRTLQPVTEGYSYAGSLSTGSKGVQYELDYWIEAGDAVAGPFRVTISPVPTIAVEQVRLEFPRYTRLPGKTVAGGQIEAVEGSHATIVARANQPLSRARIEIDPQVDAEGELARAAVLRDMTVEDAQATGVLSLRLNAARDNPTEFQYRVRGFNHKDVGAARPVIHAVRVLADLPPEISLLGPDNRVLKVLRDSQIHLEIRASDPDFGLKQVALAVSRGKDSLAEETLLDGDGLSGRQVATKRLALGDLNAVEGDRFELVAIARDNRHDPDGGQWSPNVAKSAPLVVEVVARQEFEAGKASDFVEQPKSNDKSTAADPKPNAGPANAARSSEQPETKPTSPAATNQNANQKAKNQPTEQQSGENSSAQPQSSRGDSESGQEGSSKQQPGSSGKQSGSSSSGQKGSDSGSSGAASDGAAGKGRAGTGSQAGSQAGSEQTAPASKQPGSNSPKSSGQSSRSGQPNQGNRTGSSSEKPASDGEVINRVQDYVREKQGSEQSPSQPAREGTGSEQGSHSDPSAKQSQGASGASRPQQPQAQSNPKSGAESKGQTNGSKSDGGQPDSNPSAGSSSESSQAKNEASSKNQPGANSQSGTSKQPGNGKQSSGGQSGSQQSAGSQPSGGQSSGNQSGAAKSGSDPSAGGKSAADQSKKGQPKSDTATGAKEGGDTPQGDSKQSAGGDQSGGGKSSDGKSSDGKSSDGKLSDGKSGDGKSGDGKSGDGKSGDGKSEGGQSNSAQSKDGPSKSAQPNGAQSKGAQSSGAQSGGAQPGGSLSSGSKSNEGQSSGGQPSGGQPGSRPSPGASGKGSSGASSGAGQASSGAPGPSGDRGPADFSGNRDQGSGQDGEYARNATEMVLDYLDRQREQPDPELLQRLDWTPQDLKEFVDRWQKARQFADSPDPQKRRQWDEMLQNLGLNSQSSRPRQAASADDRLRGMQESASRSRPPEKIRKPYEAFQKALREADSAK